MSDDIGLKTKGKRPVEKNYNEVLHGNITPAICLQLMSDVGKDTNNLMVTKYIRNCFHDKKQTLLHLVRNLRCLPQKQRQHPQTQLTMEFLRRPKRKILMW